MKLDAGIRFCLDGRRTYVPGRLLRFEVGKPVPVVNIVMSTGVRGVGVGCLGSSARPETPCLHI